MMISLFDLTSSVALIILCEGCIFDDRQSDRLPSNQIACVRRIGSVRPGHYGASASAEAGGWRPLDDQCPGETMPSLHSGGCSTRQSPAKFSGGVGLFPLLCVSRNQFRFGDGVCGFFQRRIRDGRELTWVGCRPAGGLVWY